MPSTDELDKQINDYLETRVDQYRCWYDVKAVKAKKYYIGARVTAAIGAVIVPVLGNITIELSISTGKFDIAPIALTIISLTVAILIALEGVLHHREQWKNYRTTEQFLQTQRSLFTNCVGDYSELDKKDGFKEFVSRVEGAIAEENAVTLNVFTRSEPPTNNSTL